MNFDKKLEELFIDLPEPHTCATGTAHAVKSGKLVFINGVLPFSEGRIITKGRVGLEVTLDQAGRAARIAAIYALGIFASEFGGSINKVKRIISVTGFIASGGDFRDHFKVLNSVSDLFEQIFGSAGKHSRNAVGCSCLPNDACLELSLVIEIK